MYPGSLIKYSHGVMIEGGSTWNTKGPSNGETTQAKGTASVQGTLAEDAKGGTCGHAFLVKTYGRHQDNSGVAGQRIRQVRRGMHFLQVEF